MTANDALVPIDLDAVLWQHRDAHGVHALDAASAAALLPSTPLLVVMHGLGADERDLLPVAALLPPDLVIASLRAPGRHHGGYSWFPITAPGRPAPEAVAAPARGILRWLDALPAEAGVALLGFSQGGLMVTQLFRLAPERFSAGVVLSGFSGPGEFPADARLAELAPPLFWGRDVDDPVITPEAIARTAVWLPEHFTVREERYPGILHGISREELADVADFLLSAPPLAPQ